MAAARTMRRYTGPGSQRKSAREGRSRNTGAHWPGSLCPVPLSFSVARGGDARDGEETVPAAPPPPPPAAPAGAATEGGGGQGQGQGATPGPTGAEGSPGAAARRVIGTAAPAHPRRSELGRSAAGAASHREPFGVASQALRSATPA